MSFLDDYALYTESLEVPEIFNLWCAMAALSAAAQRKVWLDLGMFKVAPNLYVVLNSAPGKCGKDTAMNLVREMLSATPNIFTKSDSITKEKIFEYMESVVKTHPTNNSELKHIIHCSVTIFATEMSLLIKKNDKDFVAALCALFNTIPVLKHSTKTRGENVIVNPYLCILGGTTPDWIAANVQEDVIEGGLTARTMLVYSDTPRPPNPDPQLSVAGRQAFSRIMKRLEQITLLSGQMRRTPDAKKYYEEWYVSYYTKPPSNPKMTGFYWRKRIHLLKTAMLLSLAERDSLELIPEDFQRALAILDLTEPVIEKSLSAVGRNELSSITLDILAWIAGKGKASIEEYYNLNLWRMERRELDDTLVVLTKMGKIRTESNMLPDGRVVGTITYIGGAP